MSTRGRFRATLLVAALASTGCKGGNYTVVMAPKRAIETYAEVQVSPVGVEITKDSIAQSDLMEIRESLMEAIAEQGHVQTVVPEGVAEEGWLAVDCTVTQLDKGSRGGRWLLGRFGGAAVLGVRCDFRDMAAGSVVGSADFEEKVNGGWFGGGADAIGMGDRLAKDVADYLKRGGR